MHPLVRLVLILAVIIVIVVIYGRVVGRRDRERVVRDLTPAARTEIGAELQAGHKINAIKTYRDATGAPLADAKRAVDDWFVPGRGAGVHGAVPDAAQTHASEPFPAEGRLTKEARLRISELVRAGRREDAMMLYAEATGASDSEAQAIIRSWDTEEHL